MSEETYKKSRKKIFPGNSWKEIIRNELRDVFIAGEYRKEFFVMVIYATLLTFFSILTIRLEGLAHNEIHKIYALFFLMAVYFLIDDLFRRKRLIPQQALYIVDSVFYITCIYILSVLTGGYESPIRFHLFFLTAISAPIYGTMAQMTTVIFIVSAIQILMGIAYYHGISHHLILDALNGFTYLAAAVITKFSINLYKAKANEAQGMSRELKSLYKEAAEYNTRLESVVMEKTSELQTLLNSTKGEKDRSENQRIATLNILEDMAESQQALKLSKISLETRQLELEAIAELAGKLTSITGIDKTIEVVNEYFKKFFDFNSSLMLLRDMEGKGELMVKAYINKPVSLGFLESAKREVADYLLDNKAVKKEDYQKIVDVKIDIFGNDPAKKEMSVKHTNFVLPLMTGDKIFGVIHISSEDPDVYKEGGKKSIIDAIISNASVALYGLQEIYKSQQSKTETLVKSLSNGVILLSRSFEVVLINPRGMELAGVDKAGNGLDDFLNLMAENNIKKMIDNAFTQKKGDTIKEASIMGKTIEVYVTPVSNNAGNINGVALIMHDITQSKIMDQMKSEFVSVASHQLRTPLTAIRLFIEMLMRGDVGDLTPRQKEYLNNVYESTDRMVLLVNDLLNVARIESNRIQVTTEPTQLEEMITSVINEVLPIAKMKKIAINFNKPSAKTPLVPVDKNLFRQVVHNLVTNAIKYSGTSGAVDVLLKLDGNKDYLISVKDSGIGIPEKFKDKIFQKFSRADNAVKVNTEGTGLGLYVSQKIVESFNGKIWFDTEDKKGTEFFVLMPKTGMKDRVGERGLTIS